MTEGQLREAVLRIDDQSDTDQSMPSTTRGDMWKTKNNVLTIDLYDFGKEKEMILDISCSDPAPRRRRTTHGA